jgi:hypothetical protein
MDEEMTGNDRFLGMVSTVNYPVGRCRGVVLKRLQVC